jgi:hypothetical protein
VFGGDKNMVVFEIKRYRVALGPDIHVVITPVDPDDQIGPVEISAGGIVTCIGDKKELVEFYFLNDNSPVPAPWIKGKQVKLFLHISRLPDFVDLLRNEKPVYGVVNVKNPGWSYIRTSTEPVGGEESP